MNLPCWSVTDVGAMTNRTGTRAIGSCAINSRGRSVAHAPKRAPRQCRDLRSRQQDTEGCSSQLALYQQNVAAGEQSALASNGESEAHATAFERDGWLKQSSIGADPRTRVVH